MHSFVNSLLEGNSPLDDFKLGVQLNQKYNAFSFINTLLTQNKHVKVLNFDLNFYRYLKVNKITKEVDNCFSEYSSKIVSFMNNLTKDNIAVIIGVDLLDSKADIIKLIKRHKSIVVFSYEKSFKNLINTIEKDKNILKNCLNSLILEHTSKSNSLKTRFFTLCDCYSLRKNTIESCVLEFKINTSGIEGSSKENYSTMTLEFDVFSTYKKDHKDLFEKTEKNVEQPVPVSSFNLEKTEEDRLNKQKVIVPHLKEHNENLIQVDNEDLRELYDEDPDEDLDI